MQDHSPTSQRILEIISEDEEDIEINISRASAFKKKDESTMVQDQTMISKSQYNIQYSPDEPILQYFSNGKSPQYKSVLFENPNEQPFGNPATIIGVPNPISKPKSTKTHIYATSVSKLENEQYYWYNPDIMDDVSKGVKARLCAVASICFLFICIEITGGILADSLAILADATHLFCD